MIYKIPDTEYYIEGILKIAVVTIGNEWFPKQIKNHSLEIVFDYEIFLSEKLCRFTKF